MFGIQAIGIAPFAREARDLSESFSEQVIYAASEAFTTAPDDAALPNVFFPSRVRRPLVFERSILGPDGIGGAASIGLGDIELENSDGEYDNIVGNHAIDGRRVTIKVGDPEGGFAYEDFGVIFDGTAAGWDLTATGVNVELRDWTYELEKPVARSYYGGTGGSDGTADLAGKPIPQVWGRCLNVPGVIVDPLNSLIQFNDGPMEAIDAVYNNGVALPDDGSCFTRDLAAGTITMLVGFAGQICADVRGSKEGGVYADKTADIVKRIVKTNLGWTDDDLRLASFDQVNSVQPAEVGYFIGEDVTAKSVIDELMAGIGGFRSFTRTGLLEIGVFTAPVNGGDAVITQMELLDGLERLPSPKSFYPPAWRQRVGYQRNWTVQTSGLAGAIDDDPERQAFLAQQYRYASAHDNNVKDRFLLAQDAPPRLSFFADKADAEAESLRLLALYSVPRSLYRGRVKTQPFTLDLAADIDLQYPRWDLRYGRATRAVTIRDDAGANEVELTVFA